MTAAFAIKITATDTATSTIRKVSDAVAKFARPITHAQETLAKLGKETGLSKLAKSFASVGESAAAAVEKMGTFGSAGGIASLGSVGGLALLTRQWAEMGNQASLSAYKIGIGTDQLGRLQAAARLSGVSSEAATQGVTTMAKNIGDALSGRNPQMAGYLQQLGITARYNANGQADVGKAYQDLARALANAPTAQGKNAILEALGQPEELRRLIENMDGLTASAERMRPNFRAASTAGEELNKSFTRLKENAGGVGDNMELVLAPGLKKIIDYMGGLAAKANELTRSGFFSHAAAIAGGAGAGALAGAATGAGIGALAGIPGGIPGMAIGAVTGGVAGAVRGGIGGAVVAGGVDLLGHTGSPAAPDIKGPTGVKWNNPGNLRAVGSSTGFRSFETPGEGLVAAARNLMAYENKHGINTIAGIAKRWAPPNENDTGAYTRHLSESTGILPNEPIDGSAATNARILAGIVKNEQGRQPFTPEQYAQAVAAAGGGDAGGGGKGGEVHVTVNAPPGTTATAVASQNWPVRVQYSLPSGATNP